MDKLTLGILGLGSRTTAFYLSTLNRLYNKKKEGNTTCPFLLLNTDFNSINSLLPNVSEAIEVVISQYITSIEQLNIEHILIPNITLHETIDRLKINKNIIHPIHLTLAKIKQNKWKKIVLFGSLATMNSTYIASYFKANSIEVTIPTQEDMEFIDEVRKQIYNQIETTDLIHNYHLIIDKYSQKYPVVLACTELSILKPIGNKNLIDMAQVQIQAAVNLAS